MQPVNLISFVAHTVLIKMQGKRKWMDPVHERIGTIISLPVPNWLILYAQVLWIQW